MERIAIYGKGGIGKSVIATSLSAYFAMNGKRVLHVGCDPKHDSAIRLMEGDVEVRTVLEILGTQQESEASQEIFNLGRHGIHCCESGGPPAGLGCGGRGVARTIEYLDELEVLDSGNYDVAMFDVLGDVVCGGFAAPMRKGFAEKIIIIVSEEPMAVFAANNIARAVVSYRRNGVVLAGIVANLRGQDVSLAPLERFAERLGTKILTIIERDKRILEAESQQRTIVEWAPESNSARALAKLGDTLIEIETKGIEPPTPMTDEEFFRFMRDWGKA